MSARKIDLFGSSPHCSVYQVLSFEIAQSKGRLTFDSFGLSSKTEQNWKNDLEKYGLGWFPSSAVMEKIVFSPGFQQIRQFERWFIIQVWVSASMASCAKGKRASALLCDAVNEAMTATSFDFWENFPDSFRQKLVEEK